MSPRSVCGRGPELDGRAGRVRQRGRSTGRRVHRGLGDRAAEQADLRDGGLDVVDPDVGRPGRRHAPGEEATAVHDAGVGRLAGHQLRVVGLVGVAHRERRDAEHGAVEVEHRGVRAGVPPVPGRGARLVVEAHRARLVVEAHRARPPDLHVHPAARGDGGLGGGLRVGHGQVGGPGVGSTGGAVLVHRRGDPHAVAREVDIARGAVGAVGRLVDPEATEFIGRQP